MPADVVPFACPACGEARLLEGDPAAWFCQVCGQQGPPRLRLAPGGPTPPAPPDPLSVLLALLDAIVRLHLRGPGGPWQVAAIAPLAKWPGPLQRQLTAALGPLTDPVVLVLERGRP